MSGKTEKTLFVLLVVGMLALSVVMFQRYQARKRNAALVEKVAADTSGTTPDASVDPVQAQAAEKCGDELVRTLAIGTADIVALHDGVRVLTITPDKSASCSFKGSSVVLVSADNPAFPRLPLYRAFAKIISETAVGKPVILTVDDPWLGTPLMRVRRCFDNCDRALSAEKEFKGGPGDVILDVRTKKTTEVPAIKDAILVRMDDATKESKIDPAVLAKIGKIAGRKFLVSGETRSVEDIGPQIVMKYLKDHGAAEVDWLYGGVETRMKTHRLPFVSTLAPYDSILPGYVSAEISKPKTRLIKIAADGATVPSLGLAEDTVSVKTPPTTAYLDATIKNLSATRAYLAKFNIPMTAFSDKDVRYIFYGQNRLDPLPYAVATYLLINGYKKIGLVEGGYEGFLEAKKLKVAPR